MELEIDSIIKRFGDRTLLSDVHLHVHTGDVVGILGRNGSGKSTLLAIAFGTIDAESKFIRIDGQVLQKPYRVRDCIAYLPQHSFLPPQLRVEDAIGLYLGKEVEFFDEVFSKALSSTKIRDLSGGERKYLETKLLLYSPAGIVLMDEPFNALSPLMTDFVKKLIREKGKDKIILLTDHRYGHVMDIATEVHFVQDGRLMPISDTDDLTHLGYLI